MVLITLKLVNWKLNGKHDITGFKKTHKLHLGICVVTLYFV